MRLHTIHNNKIIIKQNTWKQQTIWKLSAVRFGFFFFFIYSFSLQEKERECVQISLKVNDRVLASNEYDEVGLTLAWPVDTMTKWIALKITHLKLFHSKIKVFGCFRNSYTIIDVYFNGLSATSKTSLGKYPRQTQWQMRTVNMTNVHK